MKRKLFFAVLAAAVCLFTFALFANAVVLGDIDGDSRRTASDARLALRASVKLENYAPGSPEFTAADADGNGAINANDARIILRVSVRLDPLPEDPAEVLVDTDEYVDPVTGWAVYDELIAQIKTETDAEKRAALMHEAEENKLLQIHYAPYNISLYNEYCDMLAVGFGLYKKQNDPEGMRFCKEKMLEIPELLRALEEKTDRLAYLIDDQPEFELNASGQAWIRQIKEAQIP